MAKARWKEKHDGVIILERMFLVNGCSIKQPAESVAFLYYNYFTIFLT